MSILIKEMEMPWTCSECPLLDYSSCKITGECVGVDLPREENNCPLIELPPHGDLIDRDALIKDGWLNLHKKVTRMGDYAIYELPLKNPSIPVVIPAEPPNEEWA